MAATTPIIRFQNVCKTFTTRRGTITAVDDVTLEIAKGEIFGVIGYSGAGKSTLVRLINALEKADSGCITVNEQEITALNERELNTIRADIGMIFQQFNLFRAHTVLANVAYPLKIAKVPKRKRLERAAELLEFVGIEDKASAYPSQLSGGQQQRVGIARALAANPSILLADEATSALDPETTREVLDLLRKANTDLGVTVVIITHDMKVVQHSCDRVAVMEDGKVVETGSTYDLFAAPSAKVTKRFIQTALHDRPAPDTISRLRKSHPGRLVHVRLKDSGTGFALSEATTGLAVEASIVYGAITEVEERPFGSVTLELAGEPGAVAQTLQRLEALGSEVTDLGTKAAPIADPVWQLLVNAPKETR
jgi:D-methionine transport system ATP-binding protein